MFPAFQSSHSIIIGELSIEPSTLMGNIICSCISLVSCIAMIILFIKKPRIRSLIHSIVICIAISESIVNIGHLFSIALLIQTNTNNSYTNSILCDIQSVLIVYGEITTMVFFTIMTYCIYVYIIKQNSNLHLIKRKIIALGIIVSTVIAVIIMALYLTYIKIIPYEPPIRRDVYMKWCWIKNNDHNLFLYIYLGLQLLMMLYIVITVSFVYYSITVNESEMDTRKTRNNVRQTSRKLVAYPIVGAFGWVFTFVSSIFLSFNKEKFPFSVNNSLTRLKFQFLAVDGMYMCLKGFFIALLFFSSDKIQLEMKKILEVIKRLIQKIHQGQVNDYNASVVSSDNKENFQEQINSNFTYTQSLFNKSN